ncbi:Ankyrin repeat domain containing protein [Pandoravirus neocaledonia]|uniref:Ankyrin repeat domain containing protein n=1 Tax=Pandoravirus neocaledonia TaxID=2107708 RepID=A0A2U7UCD1_9VIRU|nr:Ankyrin repeat domain containing protein [Pandoravirus neocaledonia]AVK76121.1 Ankyrin repeat domain containing protein [Pandoravirus neocaledonia]
MATAVATSRVSILSITDLPTEIVYRIVSGLDDESFCAARAAHGVFRVHSHDEVHHKRRVPRWLAGDLCRYIQHDRADAVRAWKDSGREFDMCQAISDAVECGSVSVVDMLYDDYVASASMRPDLIASAAHMGDLNMVRLLHDRGYSPCTTDAMDYAAGNGYLAIVEFLHANRTEGCTGEALTDAAWRGHMGVVRFLCANRTEGSVSDALICAVRGCALEVIRYLCAISAECNITDALVESISANPWLAPDSPTRLPITVHLAREYIARGLHSIPGRRLSVPNVGKVLTLVALYPECDDVACSLIRLLVDDDDGAYDTNRWFVEAARNAAAAGLVNAVDILIPRCKPLERSAALAAAAQRGRTHVVRMVLAKGGGCDGGNFRKAFFSAASNGQTDVVRVLLASDGGHTWLRDIDRAKALKGAAAAGRLDTIMFLCYHMLAIGEQRQQRPAYVEAAVCAALSEHVDCVRFLVGTDDAQDLAREAAEYCATSPLGGRPLALVFDLYGGDLFAACTTESFDDPPDYLRRLRDLCRRPKITAVDLDVRNCRCETTCRFALLGKAASHRNLGAFDFLCEAWMLPS